MRTTRKAIEVAVCVTQLAASSDRLDRIMQINLGVQRFAVADYMTRLDTYYPSSTS